MTNQHIENYNIITNNIADDLITFGLNLAYYDRDIRAGKIEEANEIMTELLKTSKDYPEFSYLFESALSLCLTVEDIAEGM